MSRPRGEPAEPRRTSKRPLDPSARQLRASYDPPGAVSSGFERQLFGLAARIPLNHAPLGTLPKLRVVGSIPIARFGLQQVASAGTRG